MSKFLVETYYTCTFKILHEIDELNEKILSDIDNRNDGKVEIIDVTVNNRKTKKAGVVSQSTQTIENVQEIINILMSKVFDLRFVNTICFPTKRNQEQIKELAEACDLMIVIGSFTSANSKRLTQLAKERNKLSFQVTCANDVDESWLENVETVGISAGASTPDNIINEVIDKIKLITSVEKETIYE